MQEENINSLYNVIVENSWKDDIKDYFEFIVKEATKLVESNDEVFELIDKVLKKILSNLKNNVNIEKYDNMIMNMGSYKNDEAYDFGIGLIKSYYLDKFIIDGNEMDTLDIIQLIVEQYKTKDTLPFPEILHYVFAVLFRVHYALYIIENNKK